MDRPVELAAVAAFFPERIVARNETVDKLVRIDIAEDAAEDEDGDEAGEPVGEDAEAEKAEEGAEASRF